LNYVLLFIASILFLIVCALVFGGNVIERDPTPYFIALGFLIMVSQCIINLYVYSKNFPYKILLGPALTAHIIAIVLNFIAFLGLSLITIAGFIIEFGEDRGSDNQTGKLMVALCLFLWLIDAFLLFCQLTINPYLKRNNMSLFTAMIDSIGDKTEPTH
jgi:hypothetical protein